MADEYEWLRTPAAQSAMVYGRITVLKEIGKLLRQNMSALNDVQQTLNRANLGVDRQAALDNLLSEVQLGYDSIKAWWLDAISEGGLEAERLENELPKP